MTGCDDIIIGAGAGLVAVVAAHLLFLHRRRELRRQRDLLQAVVDAAPGQVAVRDRDGRYLLVNRAYAEFLGRSPAELVGSIGTGDDRLHGDDRRLLREGDGIDHECRWHGVAGVRTMHVIRRTIELPGGGRGLVVVGQDITDLRHAVELAEDARHAAEQAVHAKSAFLATMSHEIRTPLNGVLGMCQLLMRTRLDPDQADYARTAMGSGQALLGLINNILDFAKIEGDKIEIDHQPCDLRRMAHEVLLLMPDKGGAVEYLLEVEGDVPRAVRGDPVRLRQILLNLVGNAAKFTDCGHVLVRIHLAGDRLAVVVEDTGCGIAPEVRSRLFQPFMQADSGTTRRHGGTGLGLAISQRLAGLLGGAITVESAPGAGSRFTLDLPLVDDHASSLDIPCPPPGSLVVLAGIPGLGVRILRRMLERARLPVEESQIDELPARIRALVADGRQPRAVVVDGRPQEGCATLAASLAQAAGAPLPVVALIPLAQGDDGHRGCTGCAGVVAKPVEEDALLTVLNEVIRRPGQGSTSRYTPVVPQADSERIPARVLVAEDDAVSRRLIGLILEGLGASATLVADGRAAMEAAAEGGFDIVLMDVDMPVMDGCTATNAIRALEGAQGRRTPVIALTANALEGDREKCLQAGMDDYLSKPVTIEAVAAMLRTWVVDGRGVGDH